MSYQSTELPASAGLDFGISTDKSILCVRNSRNFVAFHELDYAHDPANFVAQVRRYVNQYRIRALAFDKNGCGEVMADLLDRGLSDNHYLEDFRGAGNEAPYNDRYRNCRAELYGHLRDFIAHRPDTISRKLPDYRQFVQDLSSVTRKFNDTGKFQVASKIDIREKLGRSPDYADAAALSMYFERYFDGWQKPMAELNHDDISKMSNRQILDTFGEFYESDY